MEALKNTFQCTSIINTDAGFPVWWANTLDGLLHFLKVILKISQNILKHSKKKKKSTLSLCSGFKKKKGLFYREGRNAALPPPRLYAYTLCYSKSLQIQIRLWSKSTHNLIWYIQKRLVQITTLLVSLWQSNVKQILSTCILNNITRKIKSLSNENMFQLDHAFFF